MAHYAILDQNNIVTSVIVVDDEQQSEPDCENLYGAKRTSYNTRRGVYYDPISGQPAADQTLAFRKNYAGPGYSYDVDLDAFVPPRPFASWWLDTATCQWHSPVPCPVDGHRYIWNEDQTCWIKL